MPKRRRPRKSPREFITLSRAWYAAANKAPGRVDEISIHRNVDIGYGGDGVSWEFTISWHFLRDGNDDGTAQLEIFCDAMASYPDFSDIVEAFYRLCEAACMRSPTVDEVEGVLESLGVIDATPTEPPAHVKKQMTRRKERVARRYKSRR